MQCVMCDIAHIPSRREHRVDLVSCLRVRHCSPGEKEIMSLSGFEPLASRICANISHNVMI